MITLSSALLQTGWDILGACTDAVLGPEDFHSYESKTTLSDDDFSY